MRKELWRDPTKRKQIFDSLVEAAIAIAIDAAERSGRPYEGAVALGCVIRGCRTIARRLNLEEEIHHIASKLCILRFEPRKASVCPDRSTAAQYSSPRAVPRILPAASTQLRARA